ncbi:NADH-quinone oxidoreductase subunit G, partial [Aldersonia kunmingensis]|uniref:NADH-quinone oxidoreductase subunit G n=1 Tax=Aldersonia kunmingensis TaxID=408066 RepID=UPI00082CDCBA
CARCTRFSQQIAGDPFIEMLERGALQQVGIYEKEPFDSYFSGNTVQVCPVGALTGTAYRFRARPFDLVSSPSVCEHCASGCAQRTDHRRGTVLRRLAGDDPEVNEEWNCDKGRWAFAYATQADRIRTPLVRNEAGELDPASWSEALAAAARGLSAARGAAGVLVGGRSTLEDAYAYAKFARVALHSNDIDFRVRAHSAEEAAFLAARVAGQHMSVSYRDIEDAPAVLLVGFEPEEESPIVFLRLRKVARKNGTAVLSIAPFTTRGLAKMSGQLVQTSPGREPETLAALHNSPELRKPGALILVGERLGAVPGGLSAAQRLAEATGARLAWIPRRAGERGAIEAGALPELLPGGRPVSDESARAEVGALWRTDIPAEPGRGTAEILAAAADGTLAGLVCGGVDPDDLPDPEAARAAIEAARFVVSLELRHSAITELADVVFPVAPVAEKAGTFLDWEGRTRQFETALRGTDALPDARVLDVLAGEMGEFLGVSDPAAVHAELARLGTWQGERSEQPDAATEPVPDPGASEAVLASWRMLLDAGRMQDGEPYLAGTARAAVVRLSSATAAEIGAAPGDAVIVSTDHGAITLPLEVADLPDRVVWLPLNTPGAQLYRELGDAVGKAVWIHLAEVAR